MAARVDSIDGDFKIPRTEEAIKALISEWQETLFLGEWRIAYEHDEDPDTEDHEQASVWRPINYQYGTIKISDDAIANHNDEDFEVLIVHELLHLRFRDAEFILDMIKDQVHRDVDDMICQTFKRDMERSIDQTAYAMVRMKRGA